MSHLTCEEIGLISIGLELALRNSRVGSHFFVRCTSKFAYGSEGRSALTTAQGKGSGAAIPPDSDLEFEVTVHEHRVYETGGYQAIELRKVLVQSNS